MEGYGFGFGGLHMDSNVVAAGAGVLAGSLELGITMSADSLGLLGTPWAAQVGTNGQILNLGIGLATTALGVIGLAGKWVLGRHPKMASFLFGWGLTAVIGGWLVPLLVKTAISGRAGRAGAAYGPSFPPPPTPSGLPFNTAPEATRQNIGLVSALSS